MLPVLRKPESIARFETKISHEPMSGCWLWTSSRNSQGYGQFFLKVSGNNIVVSGHRASWMMYRGELKATDIVCHKCDNPCCVNPDHLFVGSQKDNMRDARAKGRMFIPHTPGEANRHAVLKEADVHSIRSSTKNTRQLAQEFGVSTTAIIQCRTGARWPHLPGAHKPKHCRKKWTPQEDALLWGGATVDEIARITGRSREAVYLRRGRIKQPLQMGAM